MTGHRVRMVDVMTRPDPPYPRWEVAGTATEGYITINVMQSGNIDVKQGNIIIMNFMMHDIQDVKEANFTNSSHW